MLQKQIMLLGRVVTKDVVMEITHPAGTLSIFKDGDIDKQLEAMKRFMQYCREVECKDE
jgi:hypothetical protein